MSRSTACYDERDRDRVAYVIEQATKLRQPASMVNPSMYRCAHAVPPPPFADRGHCNPDYDEILQMLDGKPAILPFALETESAMSLQARMEAGTLTAEDLVEAYLYRIALANAEGPAIQAVRDLNPNAIDEAKAIDEERAEVARAGR